MAAAICVGSERTVSFASIPCCAKKPRARAYAACIVGSTGSIATVMLSRPEPLRSGVAETDAAGPTMTKSSAAAMEKSTRSITFMVLSFRLR